MNMDSFGEVNEKRIIQSYSDLGLSDKALSVMTLNTIFSNKLGFLIDSTRNEPRDVFDIWFLLNKKNNFDFNAKKIIAIFKQKYGFNPDSKLLISKLQKSSFKRNWELRLKKQVAFLPDFDFVLNDIVPKLKKIFDRRQF